MHEGGLPIYVSPCLDVPHPIYMKPTACRQSELKPGGLCLGPSLLQIFPQPPLYSGFAFKALILFVSSLPFFFVDVILMCGMCMCVRLPFVWFLAHLPDSLQDYEHVY